MRHLRAFLGLTVILGCRAPDVSGDVHTFVNSTNEARAMLCDCMLDLSMPDVECDPALDLFTQFDADCMVAALDGHERDGLEYLDCVNAALADYVQCVSANIDSVADSNDSCTAVYTFTATRCTQLPADVQASFDACHD